MPLACGVLLFLSLLGLCRKKEVSLSRSFCFRGAARNVGTARGYVMHLSENSSDGEKNNRSHVMRDC